MLIGLTMFSAQIPASDKRHNGELKVAIYILMLVDIHGYFKDRNTR